MNKKELLKKIECLELRCDDLYKHTQYLDETITKLKFAGTFDYNKIEIYTLLANGFRNNDGTLICTYKVIVRYLDGDNIKTLTVPNSIIHTDYLNDNCPIYEILRNDEKRAIICIYDDGNPRFYIIDKSDGYIVETLETCSVSSDKKEADND